MKNLIAEIKHYMTIVGWPVLAAAGVIGIVAGFTN